MEAIYARQSLDKKDSLSIEGQVDLCRKYAGEDSKVFCDKGYSGKNTKRPAFTELMQAVEMGEITKIYVYRLDRFSRSIADFSRLWEELERKGVEFQSVTENFDTSSPIGRAMLNIVLVFAQLERETTAERVKDNYIHRVRLGAWPGGPAPFGFDITKCLFDGRMVSTLVKNEKADVVKRIFDEYERKGQTLRGLAKMLTAEGVSGPKREAWDNVTLSRILHSPLYVKADKDVYLYYLSLGIKIEQQIEDFDGEHACNVIGKRDRSKNKYNAQRIVSLSNHEGFIPSSVWLSVQEKLAENFQIPKQNAGKYSYLTGFMKCEKCGYAVKINYSKKDNKLYLLCSGRSNMSLCDAKISVDLRELENYVEDKIIKFLRKAPPCEAIPESAELSGEILKIEGKIERLVTALSESSEISTSYISNEIERLHKKREQLINKASKENRKPMQIDFKNLDFNDKKIVAGEFIEKIYLKEDNVNIVWKI